MGGLGLVGRRKRPQSILVETEPQKVDGCGTRFWRLLMPSGHQLSGVGAINFRVVDHFGSAHQLSGGFVVIYL